MAKESDFRPSLCQDCLRLVPVDGSNDERCPLCGGETCNGSCCVIGGETWAMSTENDYTELVKPEWLGVIVL